MMRPLDLESRPLITEYFRRFPPEVSELTFTNLFVWRLAHPVAFMEAEGALVFFAGDGSDAGAKRVLGPPLGAAPLRRVLESLPFPVDAFLRISERTAAALREAGWRVEADDDNSDYVYLTADLAELKGEKYHKKRNLIQQCLASNDCRYEPLTPDGVSECREMQSRWCAARRCDLDPGLCREYSAIQETFEHYAELELIGGAIRIDGRIQAYAIAEEHGPGTAVWHFEKAMPEIRGLSQLINHWFSRFALSRFEFVNREQDLGIPGLRQAKQSYHPHHMVRKYRAFPPGAPAVPDPEAPSPRECARRPGEPEDA